MTALEQLDSIELTMENHGDAYRMIVWPDTQPKNSRDWDVIFLDNVEALQELVHYASKHHRVAPTYLHLVSFRVLKQFVTDHFE
jgi:hypothetical protein